MTLPGHAQSMLSEESGTHTAVALAQLTVGAPMIVRNDCAVTAY